MAPDRLRFAAAAFAAALLTGCTGAEVEPLPPEHPANPAATPAPAHRVSGVLTRPDPLPEAAPPEMERAERSGR